MYTQATTQGRVRRWVAYSRKGEYLCKLDYFDTADQ